MTVLIEATATYVSLKTANSDFDTRYQYLKEASTGGVFKLPAGKTAEFSVQNAGTQSFNGTRQSIWWRYECGSYVIQRTLQTAYLDAGGTSRAVSLTSPTVGGSVISIDAP